jgi:NAD(P)H-dependent FMN reductase
MIKIQILTGSSRPGRFNIQPAQWILEQAKGRTDIEIELIDLQTVALPFLDEPQSPMQHNYEHAHTKEWSAKIADADGFIFVTPEYNHSYSPVLKNAIDYLYREWNHKPVAFISYGSLAGGSRAVEHLRTIAAELKMYDLREQIMFPNYWEHLDAEGAYTFTGAHETQAKELLDSLVFWATELKASRSRLS